MSQLRISTLGLLEISLGGQPLRNLKSVKAQALLVYLAITQRPQSRQALAGLLWPDVSEESARGSLRTTLGRLRKAVGDAVVADRQSIRVVQGESLWLDAHAFEAACHKLQPGQGDASSLRPEQVETVRKAIHLYQDEFLAGFYAPDAALFDEWLSQQREYYRRLVLDSLHKLAQTALDSGRSALGIDDAHRLLALDPAREEAHRLLMKLYVQSGQPDLALRQYQECIQALESELSVPPSAETEALHDAIRGGKLTPPTASPRVEVQQIPPPRALGSNRGIDFDPAVAVLGNLPRQSSSFIGRERELAQIHARVVDPQVRLLSIVGLGGMGKTRLALQAAEAAAAQEYFAQGVFVASLARTDAVESLPSAIADAMGFIVSGKVDARTEVIDYLRNKSMLLLLDNFEHLQAAAEFLTNILEAAPGVKLLVTSRATLNLQEEWVLPVTGLHYPDPTDDNQTPAAGSDAEQSAVQLFEQRARQQRPGFNLDVERQYVVRICQLVEGMPLALELAATWLRVMPCSRIAEKLGHGLDILSSPLRNAPERHRSVRAVLTGSFDLLEPKERAVLLRLSQFRGSFDEEAAGEVAASSFLLLAQLVEKSLVQSRPDGRYELHELVRQYADEQFTEEADEANATRNRYRGYFFGKLRMYDEGARGTAQHEVLTALEGDFDNIRVAWQLAVEQKEIQDLVDGLDLVASFLEWRGRYAEGESLCRETADQLNATEHPQAAVLLIRLRTWQSTFCRLQERGHEAHELARQAWAAVERSEESAGLDLRSAKADLLAELGQQAVETGNAEAALHHLAASRSLYDDGGLERKRARVLLRECHVLRNYAPLESPIEFREYLHRARELAAESLSIYRKLQDHVGTAESLHNLAVTQEFWLGLASGREMLAEALEIYSELGIRSGILRILYHHGVAVSAGGNYADAEVQFRRLMTLAQELGSLKGESSAHQGLGYVALAQHRYQDAAVYSAQHLAAARRLGDPNDLGLALARVGRAERKLGNRSAAWRSLAEALQIYARTSSSSTLLLALPLAGLLLADAHQYSFSAEVYVALCQYWGMRDVPSFVNLPFIELASELPEEWLQTTHEARPIPAILDDLHRICHDTIAETGND